MSEKDAWPNEKINDEIKILFEKMGLADEWSNERLGIHEGLQVLGKRLSNDRYYYKSAVAIGGSGIVLQLGDSKFPQIDKAIKFPRPVPGKIQLVADMLEKEISHLIELRHPGLVGIIYYESLSNVPVYFNLPYYLMEYIDGARSKEFMCQPSTSEKEFTRVTRETAETLAYLHSVPPNGFAHLDIKHENILIRPNGRSITIDLGTCKRLRSEEVQTVVACTRSNAHPRLILKLLEDPSDNNRARGELKRSEIELEWDLWPFGIMLLNWLGIKWEDGTLSKGALHNRLTSYTRKYIMLMIARLLYYNVPTWLSKQVGLSPSLIKEFGIQSSKQLCETIARLDGIDNPINQIEELSSPSSGSFHASPGSHVPLTKPLIKVLEHPLFRRLNAISQLGVVEHVYPGAKQSRREHSLGTYANTGRIIRSLYDDTYSPLFRQIITEEDCRATLLASLLHDLGQFPLAHDLEEADNRIFDHSELTQAMLKGEWEKKKRGSKPIIFKPLNDVFIIWGTSSERVSAILAAKPTSTRSCLKDKLLRSIFNGPIDADKLDYLLRDAASTGVPYPLGIDVDRLLKCMTIVIIDVGGARDVLTIGVHSKGKVAADFLTIARYAMFSQVYWHHAVRSQKAMLYRAIWRLIAKLGDDKKKEEFKSDFINMVTSLPNSLYLSSFQMELPGVNDNKRMSIQSIGVGTDLAPTDAAVLSWIHNRVELEGLPDASLLEGILTRQLFKRLWVLSQDMEPSRWLKIIGIWDKLDGGKRSRAILDFEKRIAGLLHGSKVISVTELKAEDAEGMIKTRVAGEIPWLLIDIPEERPGSEIPLHYVLEGQRRKLRKDDRSVGDLRVSGIWETYACNLRQVAGKIRIYCDPHLVDTVEASISFEEGIEALEDALAQI